jgi:small subunit ribosomal protein S17
MVDEQTPAAPPAEARSRPRHQEKVGRVVSNKNDKTVVVAVDFLKRHRLYKKMLRRTSKFHAHDEANACQIGDLVRIIETRPLSKLKRWRVAEIVQRAVQV